MKGECGTALGAYPPSARDEFASAIDKALAWFAVGAGRLDGDEVAVGRSRDDDALALIELADDAFAIRAWLAVHIELDRHDLSARRVRGAGRGRCSSGRRRGFLSGDLIDEVAFAVAAVSQYLSLGVIEVVGFR